MDDLQRFLMVRLEDPEAAATADWLRQIRAAEERYDDFLADELELVIELSAVNLFWWHALAAVRLRSTI